MRISNIELTLNYITREGEPITIHAFLDPYGDWTHWGALREELSENVQLMEALKEATRSFT